MMACFNRLNERSASGRQRRARERKTRMAKAPESNVPRAERPTAITQEEGGAPDQAGAAALEGLVRQPRQCRHDGALYRAHDEFRPVARRAAVGPADHRHRPDRLRHRAVQPPPYRAGPSRPRRHPRARRRALRVPDPSDPGNLQATDGEPRPQPAISLAGRDPLRLSARRRRADDRLRQDHARPS